MQRYKTALAAAASCAVVGAIEATRRVWGVQPCDIPAGSNLDYIQSKQNVWYSDCFKLSVPVKDLPRRISVVRLTDDYCRSFFRCWPMQAERRLISATGGPQTPDSAIAALEFQQEDRVSAFRVVVRGSADVLFDAYDTFAYSWLGITVNAETECVEFAFGSALTGAGYRGIPLQEYLMYQLAMPFHYYYSRLLLREAVALLLREAQ